MLRGRCALITGATGGIGKAVAEKLAAEGCDLVLNGLVGPEGGDKAETDAQCRALEKAHGVKTIFHDADLARPDRIAAMVKAGHDGFGAIDIVVNNAVVRNFSRIDEFDPAKWDNSLAVNLSAAFHTIRLCLPKMRQRNWGRIINMSSVFGFFATTDRADYITTKTALLGLTRAVAMETTGHNITCNAVCPGTVLTPPIEGRIAAMQRGGMKRDDAVKEFLSTKQPTGRFVAADGVAAMVAFLCSDAAADVTGASLPVDGGWIATS